MSQAPTPSASIPDDVPVTSTDNMLDVIRSPEYLAEWLENLEARNIEKTQQATGDKRHHTLGSNLVDNLGLKTWPNVLYRLERVSDPVQGDPPHQILRRPRAMLDNIIHFSEMDGWRLDFETISDLPKPRRDTFAYLLDEDTSVDVDDLEAVGGTDALIYGPMGRGKTTVVQTLVARILEINNEAVVWRGTPQRTEWLPFAPWTVVCLPEGIDYTVMLAPPEDDAGFGDLSFEPIEVNLSDIVWDVRRYQDLDDLNNNVLTPGAFHVVYPDPKFRGCEEITRYASECDPQEFTSAWDADSPDEVTPTSHWWFGWIIHHNVNEKRSMRSTWICDEASNLFKHHASGQLESKLKSLSQQYVDFRRNGLSFVLLTQKPKEISWMVRKKMRWGVTLSGAANPTPSEEIIGSNPQIPRDLTTNWPLGKALFWTAGVDHEFRWDDIPRRLKVPGKLRVYSPEVREVKSR